MWRILGHSSQNFGKNMHLVMRMFQSNYDTKGKTAVDTVFRYDPRTNGWMEMASLNEKRTFFHLSAIGAHLYAVGGRNSAGELATVEKYHPKENQVNLNFFKKFLFTVIFRIFDAYVSFLLKNFARTGTFRHFW